MRGRYGDVIPVAMGAKSGANERLVFDCKCSLSKRCPDVRRDGDGIVLSDEESDIVPLEDARRGIRLSADDARKLRKQLQDWGF